MNNQPTPTPEGGNYSTEAADICKLLKAKGLIMVVFDGGKGTGLSVYVQDKETLRTVPTLLRRLINRMEREMIWEDAKGKG